MKVTPGGRPDSPQLGAGYPPVVTVKLKAEPSVAVALPALVNDGARPTTIVKAWVAFGLIPLLALMPRLVVPVAVAVPEIRAVPLPLSANDRPAGQRAGLGDGGHRRSRRGDGGGPGLASGEERHAAAGDGGCGGRAAR